MSTAPVEFDPLVFEDCMLSLDGKDYASAVDNVTLVPTTTKVNWNPVNGRSVTKVPKPKWAMTLNVGQSFDRAGLTAQLIENHGKAVPFTLTPASGAAAKIEGTVVLEASQIGGGSEDVATAGVTLDINGQPDFTWNTESAG